MESLAKRLGRRLRELRGEQTLRAFARTLGIHPGSLHRIERGAQNTTVATLQKICLRLRCDVADLFEPKPQKTPRK